MNNPIYSLTQLHTTNNRNLTNILLLVGISITKPITSRI